MVFFVGDLWGVIIDQRKFLATLWLLCLLIDLKGEIIKGVIWVFF